jgi:succinate-semialdehyde dehydrogenase/glutarate-semialdehyde dehydrogenase
LHQTSWWETILLKHASIDHNVLCRNLFKEAGAPEGLYTNLMISGKEITLVDDVRIKGISLTGKKELVLVWQQQQVKI